jgi:hypothetical protein
VPILLIFLVLRMEWRPVYVSMVQENAPVETTQAVAYGAASLLAVLTGLRARRTISAVHRAVLLALAVLLMFVCMEEISWGQRIWGLATPEWFQRHNMQHEISLHNLWRVQLWLCEIYTLVGLLFSLGWIPVNRALSAARLGADTRTTIRLFRPQWYLMLYFAPTAIVYPYFALVRDNRTAMRKYLMWQDQEPVELLLALGFFLFVAAIALRIEAARSPCGPSPT